jgi:dTDP-4-dehydrorhamnose reductase
MSERKTILVTGANGQLGQEIARSTTQYSSVDFLFLTREQLDIQDSDAVRQYLNDHTVDFLINCAAYTAVDKAEEEKEQAFLINATAPALLAKACKEQGSQFIHISTDYVFDGAAIVPYKETDPTNPQNVYGASKLKGEELILSANPSSIIIRTSWVYSSFGKNFVKTMLRLLTEKKEISVVSDQVGSPTYAADLAELILRIIVSGNWHPGIYHFSNEGIISWYEFATAIKEIIHSNCEIKPIPSYAYPTPAKRPNYSVLDKSKIISTYHLELIDWKISVRKCMNLLLANK